MEKMNRKVKTELTADERSRSVDRVEYLLEYLGHLSRSLDYSMDRLKISALKSAMREYIQYFKDEE